MTKFMRFAFLPVFFAVLFSNQVWAVTPVLTGTFKVVGAKYAASSLASCAGATITLKITSQCGKVLKGSITIGTATIPVTGRVYTDNTTIYLNGYQTNTGSTAYLMGSYQASPAAIKVINGTFDFFSPTAFPYMDAVFDDFSLAKQ